MKLVHGVFVVVVLAVAVVLGACAVAYDPTSRDNSLLVTRADEAGVSQTRARAQRFTTVQAQTAERTTDAGPAPVVAPPEPPAGVPAEGVPESPVGRELAWFITVLNGADISVRRGRAALESHFDEAFLKQVPPAQLRGVVTQWRKDQFDNGSVELVRIDDGASDRSLVALVRGTRTDKHTQIRMRVNAEGKIAGLLLSPVSGLALDPTPTWGKLDDQLVAASGPGGRGKTAAISLGVYEIAGGTLKPVHALGASNRLAIGSAFKLYVLGALAQMIEEGKAKWDEPLAINDDLKSLPSGKMQLLTAGEEFPLAHYAREMISISDNTATDHLMAKVGRERIEAYMGSLHGEAARNRPFLSTLDVFKIKLGEDRELAARYAAADESTRRRMLERGGDVEKQIPNLMRAALWRKPYAIDTVEWFASAEELARVMADLHAREGRAGMEDVGRALRINPGIGFDGRVWSSVAFKGGSEPGVLSMTWLLTRKDGRVFVLTLTMNDTAEEVDQGRFIGWAQAAGRLLGEER